ncbi:helix-turn-helix domain-containing protein [Vallicoccus soli]|uniref:ArsR family transcriptional regulator n=1 Tax=Vallicoccus soli TaxID=2339232 RepID=A0A3A3YU39_9ACTN|nr:helix-turn-helix domain-containing protein [Vallicoccus soli]RJK94975.1 ArsR family transcriptional regulator [Vallicoccus soli]
MPDVAVLEDPAAALAALDPRRSRLLAALAAEPASAAAVAARVGLPRQQVGHHLRALEEQGLVVEVGRRRHGGIVERVLAASAASYVVSPGVLGGAAADPARVPDRLSAAYLVALAGRAVREVGGLLRGAQRAGQRLPTLSLDVDVRFASAADRSAFAAELAGAVRDLAARYHDEGAAGGRTYRVVVLAHPRPQEQQDPQDPQDPQDHHHDEGTAHD